MTPAADSSLPFVSVIIPVFNDITRLKLCLSALEKQTYPLEHCEIIVVDNGSEEDVASIVTHFPNATFAQEPRPGSYAARNQGIALAKGEYLAFTDADCIPAPHWLEAGIAAILAEPDCGLVAGKIELFYQDPQHPTPVEIYESIELDFPQDKLLETEHFGVTANLFTRRSVIERVGPFNAEIKSGGDKEWGQRVFAAGYTQLYSETALVNHPARYSWHELYKRVTRINGGLHDLTKTSWTFSKQLKRLFRDIGLLTTPPFRSLFRIWSDQRLPSRQQRLWFIQAMLFVRYVSAWERIRLALGGESRRW